MPKLMSIHKTQVENRYVQLATSCEPLSVEYDQLWEAENTVKKFHRDIGLSCCAVMRDFYTNGPSGPALLVLVATDGSAWQRGVYLCLVENADKEPMFFLDDGENFAYREAISGLPDLKQWRFPWPHTKHMPAIVQSAELAAINLLKYR